MADKNYFSKVREARDALKGQSLAIFETQLKIIQAALDSGDYETAAKANQWLLEHLPKEDGLSVLDASIDKAPPPAKQTGPNIQIGIALGGMNHKTLPSATVIDIPTESDE